MSSQISGLVNHTVLLGTATGNSTYAPLLSTFRQSARQGQIAVVG